MSEYFTAKELDEATEVIIANLQPLSPQQEARYRKEREQLKQMIVGRKKPPFDASDYGAPACDDTLEALNRA